MINLLLEDFVHRVLTSEERVQFSHVDPYGHLNASRYTEFLVNHRITAAEDQLSVFTMDLIKSVNTAFVINRIDIRYQSPSFLSETLEIGSWVESLSERGFILKAAISGVKDKKIRAGAIVHFSTVDPKTGKPVACPSALPSRLEVDPLKNRPDAKQYLESLKYVPDYLLK